MRWFLSLLLFLGSVTASSAQVIGYTGNFWGEIIEHRLGDGDPVPFEELRRFSPFGGSGPIFSLEHDNGLLYALYQDEVAVSLYVVDLEAESATLLVRPSLTNYGTFDLALDGDGLLWLTNGLELHTYNLETDVLTFVTNVPTQDARGMAWWQGELYLLNALPQTFEAPTLNVVDPATAVPIRSRELPGLLEDINIGLSYGFQALSFDDAGGLWIGYDKFFGLPSPPVSYAQVARLADPWTSEPDPRMLPNGELQSLVPLAVRGRIPIAQIPTASGTALGVTVVLLAFAAFFVLGRGRRADQV